MKTAAFALASLVVLGAAPARAATKIQWLVGHRNLDFFEAAAISFKQTVEAGSDGELEVDIIVSPAPETVENKGAQGTEITAKVASGEAQMGHSFVEVLGGTDPRVAVVKSPFAIRDYRHMEGVIEGPVGSGLLDGMRSHGLVGLSFTYSGGANGVASIDRPIRRPEDLKGLRVGVYGDAIDRGWLESVGAVPVALGSEPENILRKTARGELDAAVVTWRNFDVAGLAPTYKTMSLVGSSYLVSVTYVNAKFFDGLPEKHRALILKASREAGRLERFKTIMLNENARQALIGRGVREVHLSAKNRAKFEEALRPAYAAAIEPLVGRELLDRVKAAPDGPGHPVVDDDSLSRR